MRNDEIVKALRCCVTTECSECPADNGDPMDIGCAGCVTGAAADLIEKLTDRCARYAEEIAVLQARQKWIPVTERLPENEKDVLILFERFSLRSDVYRVVGKAFYTDGKTNTENSDYAWETDCIDMEYDEDADAYIIPKGWWESIEFGETFSAVDMPVLAWMPLPEAPEVEDLPT